jgi:hypothetical protein
MDREFIIKNQIVERYISGRLPPKGITDFEREIRANPGLVEELGIPERVNAALRLLDTAGASEPWAEQKKKFWESTAFVAGTAAVAVIAIIGALVLFSSVSDRDGRIAALQKENVERPIAPSTSRVPRTVTPSRGGPPNVAAFTISAGELADLKIDVSYAAFGMFRASLDRVDHGRVIIADGLERDSNGHIRFALNANAFGPGDYLLTIEGLNMRREATPSGHLRFHIAH